MSRKEKKQAPSYPWQEARVAAMPEGGYGLYWGQHLFKTPKGLAAIAPTRALAEAIAEEARAQGEKIDPLTMPLTSLALTGIDLIAADRTPYIIELLKYLETDLVCFRLEQPLSLATQQATCYDPLLAWFHIRYDAHLPVTTGLAGVVVPPLAHARLEAVLRGQDDLSFAALMHLCQTLGSIVLALAFFEGQLDIEGAFAAAELEGLHQLTEWGMDPLTEARHKKIRAELSSTARFLEALRTI
jgi:chaperone required for assembly of F1-ATPase